MKKGPQKSCKISEWVLSVYEVGVKPPLLDNVFRSI